MRSRHYRPFDGLLPPRFDARARVRHIATPPLPTRPPHAHDGTPDPATRRPGEPSNVAQVRLTPSPESKL